MWPTLGLVEVVDEELLAGCHDVNCDTSLELLVVRGALKLLHTWHILSLYLKTRENKKVFWLNFQYFNKSQSSPYIPELQQGILILLACSQEPPLEVIIICDIIPRIKSFYRISSFKISVSRYWTLSSQATKSYNMVLSKICGGCQGWLVA